MTYFYHCETGGEGGEQPPLQGLNLSAGLQVLHKIESSTNYTNRFQDANLKACKIYILVLNDSTMCRSVSKMF